MASSRVMSIVCTVMVGTAHAQSAPPPPREHARCDSGPYLEPSFMVVLEPRLFPHWAGLSRVAAGALVRLCAADGAASTHLRVGATGFLSNLRSIESSIDLKAGFGLEG